MVLLVSVAFVRIVVVLRVPDIFVVFRLFVTQFNPLLFISLALEKRKKEIEKESGRFYFAQPRIFCSIFWK
ncbi:MAG: hypothetical protein ACP5O3_02010 [Candidatus Micrarchaeia archaeon]